MSFIFIIALIIIITKNKKEKQAWEEERQRLMMGNPDNMGSMGSVPSMEYSPEIIGQEAENLRRAEENALRTKAETLLPDYEKSGLVRDLLKKIQEAMGYEDLLWDIELNDDEVVLTTMTDAMEDRMVLVREFYEFQTLGYQSPSRESCHRLALALAIQKGLGSGYGINYQFRYDTRTNSHVMSDLKVSFRQKQGKGTTLKSPLQAAEGEL